MDNSEIAIRVQNLSKVYPITQKDDKTKHPDGLWNKFSIGKKTKTEDFYALKDVSFEIKKGEAVGIIGRNGAGKSTLLKILSGITEPSDGRIEIYGTVASVLDVGMGFHPELTGRENIYLSGTMLGIPKKKIAEKFNEIVEFAGVEKFIDTPVKHYSSGMYVRLAFSVVTNIDADILLFDEVLSVGDLAFQMKCSKRIKELVVKKKKTVLLVSHNMNDISAICQKVLHIQDGCLVSKDNQQVIISSYIHSINTNKNEQFDLNNDANCSSSSSQDNIGITIWSIGVLQNGINKECCIDINSSFELYIDFYKYSSDTLFHFCFNIYHMGNLFLSANTIKSENNIIIKDKGNHRISMIFPSKLLNIADYNVDVYVSCEDNLETFFISGATDFHTFDSSDKSENKLLKSMNSYIGPLNPSFEWKVEDK